MNKWPSYFRNLCEVVGSNSSCKSRSIGAVLARGKKVVATGYNGPPSGIPHCGRNRIISDQTLSQRLEPYYKKLSRQVIEDNCPRKILGYESGEGMEWCTATHAEQNCIANAASLGVCTQDTTLYMNSVIPCSKCLAILINAGVKLIVIDDATYYDTSAEFIVKTSNIAIATFDTL